MQRQLLAKGLGQRSHGYVVECRACSGGSRSRSSRSSHTDVDSGAGQGSAVPTGTHTQAQAQREQARDERTQPAGGQHDVVGCRQRANLAADGVHVVRHNHDLRHISAAQHSAEAVNAGG